MYDKHNLSIVTGGAKHLNANPYFSRELAVTEANKCLGCKAKPCQKGCPISTDIPEVIKLFKDGKVNDAGRMLFMNNPLTTVCCVVCNHQAQCEGHCVQKKNPVHFHVIENYISNSYALSMNQGPAPRNGYKVAVVGAGPAGLTIAVILARYGYDVTIFEHRSDIGGVMRYAIPEFRLPNSVLDDFSYRHLFLKGIKFRPNIWIGTAISVDDLFRDGFAAVFAGTGLGRARALNIPGESGANVTFALQYLANADHIPVGDTVAVIGAGNSAMDCARTARRFDAKKVVCFSITDKIVASEEESESARAEGVEFAYSLSPVEIFEDGVVFRRTEVGEDGKVSQIVGTEVFFPCDRVIVSIGQLSKKGLGTELENRGGIFVANEKGMTSHPGVFAAGDAVAGARTVVEAVASAKKVAEAMHEYMQSLGEEGKYKENKDYPEISPDEFK